MDDRQTDNTRAEAQPLSRIVLGVPGGIAAYKAAELVRLLV
jgi:phosphopantothenoylcysteine synthetase/decarboxylase